MSIFTKKPKKTPEEIKSEREANIANTSKRIKISISKLETKKEIMLKKIVEARRMGLKDQERQARNLLKQIMASINRENGMLMTLELAVEARDLAELNASFMESIGTLSEEILKSDELISDKKVKKVGDKFLEAIYRSNQQKERINNMLEIGEFASAIGEEENISPEFDDEIDALVDDMELGMTGSGTDFTRTRQ